MAGCYHGIPGGFCAICNDRMRPRDDGHPVARPDDEPRFAKGRDSAKWVGYGQWMRTSGDTNIRAAARENGPRSCRMATESVWSRYIQRGDTHEPVRTLTLNELAILAALRGGTHD